MQEITPSPLHIPEIALSIIGHLDPTTVLSIRLVSFPNNTLILTHQRSISRSVAQRNFSTDIDWPPPDINCLQKNYHLKTLNRLPKAYMLARRANKNFECYAETRIPGKRHVEESILKPTPLYPAFLGRCARAILVIWTLNDIRQHLDDSESLPSYVSPPPPPSHQGRLGRLFSRMTMFTSKPDSASLSPVDANAQTLSLYVNSLKPRSILESQKNSSTLDAARQKYLNSLSRNLRIDMVWVQYYLFIGLPRGTRKHPLNSEGMVFALHQSPTFMLSLCSDDQCERLWAQNLAHGVIRAKESLFSLYEGESLLPLFYGEEVLEEEVIKAKRELTRGDWRNRGGADGD